MAANFYKYTKIPTEKETDRIAHFYFKWLYSLVGLETKQYSKYWRLLENLYSHEYTWYVDNDVNRAMDGINLRQIFCRTYGYDYSEIDPIVFERPCTFLEMLIGLARRIDSDIMWDPEAGDRTSYWFWMMLRNAGFIDASGRLNSDEYFDAESMVEVAEKVDFIVNRRYDSRGNGGLFQVEYLPDGRDFRDMELWYQMQFCMNERFPVIDDTFG